ncbi:nuclear transport factor 2 family protein [Flagellimonas sediminis]|uniref:Steroid delta-isomerase n=1 Tax=Flagellimonas sediminis TaxID=2696468 RepID=A0A6I5KTU1_9FLAO|nr:nuclear transport factor 2 family protein [Allomuricauda sediminis]NDV43903.1 steroid delta-isomerase [Allomuricauda sediminis]
MSFKVFIIVNLLGTILLNAQPNTEVYLFDLTFQNDMPLLSNPKNISNNDGYDNQPSFWDDDTVLFASTREDQTDIVRLSINEGSKYTWLTNTPIGSEYSPLKIPGKNAFSAIRLDLDGLQRLYEYDLKTGNSTPITNLKIGYHVWMNKELLVATVLVENRMDLVVINLKENSHYTVQKNVGRSLHKIPGKNLISYLDKTNYKSDKTTLKSLDPFTGQTEDILNFLLKVDDFIWLPDGSLLVPDNNRIAMYNPKQGNKWQDFYVFDKNQVFQISRMALSPNGKRFALVSEISPVQIAEQQVDRFNNRNLNSFLNCFTDNILVERFSGIKMYQGKDAMLENYERFFNNTKTSSVEVIKRIAIGNKIIDEEKAFVDGNQGHQVAIYEVSNGLISSMTFIFSEEVISDAEAVVQKQLDAYNARDIDAFLDTYSENIKLYNFPNQLFSEGKTAMETQYGSFFENTPDLHCTIKNRMVIGNKVIDEESVTVNGSTFSAVAIYEVEKGKIVKVTFLR